MKRIEMAHDYAEFLIRARMAVTNIEKAMNDKQEDMAKFMARELEITARLLGEAIQRKMK